MTSVASAQEGPVATEEESRKRDGPAVHALRILGSPVADLGWEDALTLVDDRLSQGAAFTHIAFLNANNANIMASDEAYQTVLGRSLVLADGVGVDLAARVLYGKRFHANLNGTDFVPALLTYVERPLRIGLLGAKPEVLEKAAANMRRHVPWHRFDCICDGYFDRAQPETVKARIADADVDLLLVAMGTPLQEKWIDENLRSCDVRVAMSVGALFDFVSGYSPRAPSWLRALRLEWLYRLWQEPSRLWRRYVIGIPVFLVRVLLQKRTKTSVEKHA